MANRVLKHLYSAFSGSPLLRERLKKKKEKRAGEHQTDEHCVLMFCCSVIVDRLDRGIVNLTGLQTPLFCGYVLSGCRGPVAMYTGRVPGVFVQDAVFLCA